MILDYYSFCNNVEIEIFQMGESWYINPQYNKFYNLIFLDIVLLGIIKVETGLKIRNELQNEATQIVCIF